MNVLVRADASVSVGTGHIFRTLTVARQLIAEGHDVRYACRDLPENFKRRLKGEHIEVIDIPDDEPFETEIDFLVDQIKQLRIEWLIVDHYLVQETYYGRLKELNIKILSIDDINVTKFPVNVLVNQNILAPTFDYQCSNDTAKLLGPDFATVSPIYAQKREQSDVRKDLKNILVFLGGSDVNNYTLKVMMALETAEDIYHIDVVLGPIFKFSKEVEEFTEKTKHDYQIYQDLPDLSDLMLKADLAIGAGGIACWEMCTLYLPMILIPTADNQVQNAQGLSQEGAAIYPGKATDITNDDMARVFSSLNADQISRMSAAAGRLCDGRGIERILERLK